MDPISKWHESIRFWSNLPKLLTESIKVWTLNSKGQTEKRQEFGNAQVLSQ